MKHVCLVTVGVCVLIVNVGCSGTTAPLSPTLNAVQPTDNPGISTSTVSSSPIITMQRDLTVSPSRVTVSAGYRVRFVNNSALYVQIHSYNCSEFQMVDPSPGTSIRTQAFRPAGKVCDFFAYDQNWQKIFVGQVHVVQ